MRDTSRTYRLCRALLLGFGLAALLLWPKHGRAEETPERATIAIVLSSGKAPFAETLEGFREFFDRSPIDIDYITYTLPEAPSERGRLMERIASRDPDLLFVLGSDALEAAGRVARDIPIVAGMILRKEDFRLVPGSTGVYLEFPVKTQFAWLKRILPQAETVGVVYNGRENGERIQKAKRIAGSMGLTLVAQEVENAREIPAALENLAKRADVLWGISDDVVLTPQTARHLLLFSFRQRIPFIGLSAAWVRAGAFYALDRDYADIGRQCAEMALEVLTGRKAGAIPPRGPRKVAYALNLKAVRQMKIELPAEVLRNAAEVF